MIYERGWVMQLSIEMQERIEALAAETNIPPDKILALFFNKFFPYIESYFLHIAPKLIPEDKEKYIPLTEVVEILKYASSSTLSSKLKSGQVRGEKRGVSWYMPVSEVEKMLATQYSQGRKRGAKKPSQENKQWVCPY